MSDEQRPKKSKWIPILIGVVLVFMVLAVGGIMFSVAFFRQSMTVTDASDTAAASEFDTVRARFAGQQPLIEMREGRPQYMPERAGQKNSTVPLKTMHVMAYDEDEGKLVTFALPFWLLRLKSGPIRLSAYSQGWDDRGVSFRIEDLEKFGPGLLMDITDPREGRVLIWVE